ncbi:MAG: peptide chain release factor 2 [Pirellulaceae bacterium]|nr:peptide chain release factor 2 [Pirellulaceae bacterium]
MYISRRTSTNGSFTYETVFDYAGKKAQIADIEQQMAAPRFWDNQESAQQTVATLKAVKAIITPLEEALRVSGDLDGLIEMAKEDPSLAAEVTQEVTRLAELVEDLELKSLLSGPNDEAGAILSVNARDGGTDAADWAEMLLQMYTAWARDHDYEVELIDRNDNEEAGINSATIAIRGALAYGYLKGETGIHRLVRISPFNAEGKRQTSFAAVDVSPDVSDDVAIDIDEADVRVDTFRASGAGGQHVNKTSSAIRLTHLPTGIVVQCQNERSQHKNRATAWKLLRGRMARVEEEKREAEQAQKYKEKSRVGFGSQIRNYFLHPDQRVKDVRTGYAEGSFQKVLSGGIQGFLDAYLRWRVGNN